MKPYRIYNTRQTPQSEPIPGSQQVVNSAGGYAFAVSDWTRLDRFLVLGSESGSYYATERALTIENAEAVRRCLAADGPRVVRRIVEVSEQGRAPKNDPALFALAMCAGLGDADTKKAALAALPQVARIGTHLFHFLAYVEQFRGWGRSLRSAVAAWYNDLPADKLAYQVIKYQQRDGWSHHDLLHLAHPKPTDAAHNALYRWAKDGTLAAEAPGWLQGFAAIQTAESAAQAAALIRDYGLPREAVPTQFLTDIAVWEALLADMPMTALIRNLATMTRVGLLAPMSQATNKVVAQLSNAERLKAARVHPIALLAAMTTYSTGRGRRGKGAWQPAAAIVDALDAAFYTSFGNVEPTGKRMVLALDVSGSMSTGALAGVPGLTPRVGSAAMALITAATEPNYAVVAFSHAPTQGINLENLRKQGSHNLLVPVAISPRERLDDVVRRVATIEMGGTDCALPMLWALANKVEADAFVIYTDSETWAGDIHPVQALREYRQRTGIAAKLIVVGMVPNNFSIADPDDGGMLDVVGFDTAAPQVMSDFIAQA